MRPFAPFAVLAVLLAAAVGAVAKPEATEDGDKIVLQNDHLTVWFHGKKPMLKLFPTAEANNTTAGYSYHFREVVEYRDVDADGLPSNAEVLASLSLEKASAFEVNTTEADGVVTLNLTLEAPVKVASGLGLPQEVELPDRTARVALVFTLRQAQAPIEMEGVNFTVLPSAVKYDFVVERWPTVDSATSRLALVMQVDAPVETDVVGGLETATVGGNGTELGAIAWTATARGTTAQGTEMEVPVKAKVAPTTGEDAEEATRIVYTYDAPGLTSLVHDPVLGVATTDAAADIGEALDDAGDRLSEVPSPGLLAGVGVLAVAALVWRRR